jgi:hypothetical protein
MTVWIKTFRSKPLAGMTPITVTKSYITEVINVMVLSTAAPLLYVICFRPLPVAAAQLSYSAVYSCFTLIVALGGHILLPDTVCCEI